MTRIVRSTIERIARWATRGIVLPIDVEVTGYATACERVREVGEAIDELRSKLERLAAQWSDLPEPLRSAIEVVDEVDGDPDVREGEPWS
jgi:hypothetical protein